MFASKLPGWWPVFLAGIVVGLGYYMAFLAPNDVERALTRGETYIFLARSTPTDFEIIPIQRQITKGLNLEAAAKATIEELLKGPTEFDRENGFFSAIPEGVVVNQVRIEDDLITVDFNNRIDQGVAGSATVLAIRGQLEKTLLRLPGIKQYRLTVDGGSREVQLEP